jgi:uncharacterized tellurite resistance protein B-like protein
MIKNITKFFEDFMEPSESASTKSDGHSIQFATAVLMMEVSRSDEGHKQVEKDAILGILQRLFEFSDLELAQLMELAEDASEEAHDLYSFTRLINEHYEYNTKIKLVIYLWEVAFADGRLDAFEEHIIRKISGLLHLANQDFIKAKIIARESTQA